MGIRPAIRITPGGSASRKPGEPVKTSSSTTVTRCHVTNREFYIKRCLHERRELSPVAYFVRSDKSRREWRFAPEFQTRGIAVVSHLAHGERWGWYGLLENALITEGLPSYVSLLAFPGSGTPAFQGGLSAGKRTVNFLRNQLARTGLGPASWTRRPYRKSPDKELEALASVLRHTASTHTGFLSDDAMLENILVQLRRQLELLQKTFPD